MSMDSAETHIVCFLLRCSAECLNPDSIGENLTKWALITPTNLDVGGGQVALRIFFLSKKGKGRSHLHVGFEMHGDEISTLTAPSCIWPAMKADTAQAVAATQIDVEYRAVHSTPRGCGQGLARGPPRAGLTQREKVGTRQSVRIEQRHRPRSQAPGDGAAAAKVSFGAERQGTFGTEPPL